MNAPTTSGLRPAARRKLIEVALPLEAINREAAREKSIRHGHPSTLHLWWARRPLAACRAVLFGQLVDDPSAWPHRFDTPEKVTAERERLHRLIERLVPWEASTNEAILDEARFEIARSVAWGLGEEPPREPAAVLAYLQEKAPPVYDPFCGGGSIPLEAQRLGLRAYGSDLNPVAVLITKALVEIPPKFAGQPPVNPDARKEAENGELRAWRGAQGLAADVRYYGRWMRDEAERRIGHLYPKARLPDGSDATVIAWLWARTVASPNPAANGARVPLVSSFMLSTKEGRKAWVEPVLDADAPDGWRFEVRTSGSAKEEERARKGTKAGKGQGFLCVLTGTPIPRTYVQDEGKAGQLGVRLMAVVAEAARKRLYLAATAEHEAVATSASYNPAVDDARSSFLSGETPTRAMVTGGVCSAYGLSTWGHLFTPRQLVALTTVSDLVADARERALADASAAGLSHGSRLADDGLGAEAYADAVATYLGCAVDRAADFWNGNATWEAGGGFIAHLFTRQAIPMTWDFSEANPFSLGSGNWEGTCLEWIERVLREVVPTSPSSIFLHNAANGPPNIPNLLVSTDPPYYDNISYADLSDFFYVWARRTLREVWPSLLSTMLTPKKDELVATPYRHGGRAAAQAFFMTGMKRAVGNMEAVSAHSLPLAIYYAFKQSEDGEDGVASTGWATFLQSIVDSGLMLDATLPLRTERSARTISIGTNALASSIVLVCRCRPADAPVTTRAQFLRDLRRELPEALRLLQAGAIAPVDLAQAAIGPGMAIFTRYSRVLGADDTPMPVKAALQDINAALDEHLSEQEAAYDAPTRFAVTWFDQNGMAASDFGSANTLATARGISVAAVRAEGIVESGAGKVRLRRRDELAEDWSPERATIWQTTQALIAELMGDGGSEERAAGLLARLNGAADPARDLATLLYRIADRRKWADEAYAYNALVASWPRLVDLARGLSQPAAQGEMGV